MKKLLMIILLFLLSFVVQNMTVSASENPIDIHYFYSSGCSVCKQITEFLNDYLPTQENINLITYNVLEGGEKEQLFIDVSNTFNRENLRYPYIVIGGKDLQGLYEIQENIDSLIQYYRENPYETDIVEKVKNAELVLPGDFLTIEFSTDKTIELPIIGEIKLAEFSLFLGAVVIGLIDGFNPCAMWILIFLITLLINLKDRKKIWILGLTFILTSGLIYYVIMMSWLQLVIQVTTIQIFQIAIGVLSLIFAFFSLRHFWKQMKTDAGCEVTNAESKRKLMGKIRNVINKNSYFLAITGIMGIAITVNVIELACSAGLPVIYSTMLGYHDISFLGYSLYILVYVLFFIFDDLLIFSIAVISHKVTGISNKYAKYSNLLGGLIMLILGIFLIFFPDIIL